MQRTILQKVTRSANDSGQETDDGGVGRPIGRGHRGEVAATMPDERGVSGLFEAVAE